MDRHNIRNMLEVRRRPLLPIFGSYFCNCGPFIESRFCRSVAELIGNLVSSKCIENNLVKYFDRIDAPHNSGFPINRFQDSTRSRGRHHVVAYSFAFHFGTSETRTIAFYQEFLAAHPENHSAHLWLLDLLIADRRCAEAREVLDKMHRLKPTYNDDFYLGCILLQEGHTDDALAQWEAMCAKYPDTWEVYVMRASELAKLGHYDEAIADYEKTMTLMPPPRFVDPAEAIAQICEIRGDYETAITYYEKVIAIEKADWHETQGEAIDAPQRSIARLREKLASR